MKLSFLLLIIFGFCFAFSTQTLAQSKPTTGKSVSQKPLVDFDITGAAGSYNGQTYSEIHLGLNLNMTDWLTWRNAGFRRFSPYTENEITGLDSTLRLILENRFQNGGYKLFGGAGFRVANPDSKSALVAEAGAGLQIGRFGFGGGLKYLQYNKKQIDSTTGLETKKDDLIYFVTIAGGAGTQF